jgi:hypothetical protein
VSLARRIVGETVPEAGDGGWGRVMAKTQERHSDCIEPRLLTAAVTGKIDVSKEAA